MITRSGSGRSAREETHGATLCLAIENFECQIVEVPDNHGSIRTVNLFGEWPVDSPIWFKGSNIRRKEASLLRCLRVRDIVALSPERHHWINESRDRRKRIEWKSKMESGQGSIRFVSTYTVIQMDGEKMVGMKRFVQDLRSKQT